MPAHCDTGEEGLPAGSSGCRRGRSVFPVCRVCYASTVFTLRQSALAHRCLGLAGGVLLFAVSGLGCAGTPPPTERLTTAEAAIRGAMEVDANSLPRGALHLKLAQEQVDKAKRYLEDDMNQRADLALRRAQADAELAIALAREHEMKEKARSARTRLERLKVGRAP